jgi:hypothetical protein
MGKAGAAMSLPLQGGKCKRTAGAETPNNIVKRAGEIMVAAAAAPVAACMVKYITLPGCSAYAPTPMLLR